MSTQTDLSRILAEMRLPLVDRDLLLVGLEPLLASLRVVRGAPVTEASEPFCYHERT